MLTDIIETRTFEDFDAAWGAAMREADLFIVEEGLKLKSVKHYVGMSHETECFSAFIWRGSRKIASAENQGCGGCTMIGAASPKVRPDFDALMHRWNARIADNKSALVLVLTDVFDRMLERYLKVKEAKRLSRSKVSWYSADGQKVWSVKMPTIAKLWKSGGNDRVRARAQFKCFAAAKGWIQDDFDSVVFANDVALGVVDPIVA